MFTCKFSGKSAFYVDCAKEKKSLVGGCAKDISGNIECLVIYSMKKIFQNFLTF
jgi:hypothetical protein